MFGTACTVLTLNERGIFLITIGYERARALMRQLDWKLLVTADKEGEVERLVLCHSKQPNPVFRTPGYR